MIGSSVPSAFSGLAASTIAIGQFLLHRQLKSDLLHLHFSFNWEGHNDSCVASATTEPRILAIESVLHFRRVPLVTDHGWTCFTFRVIRIFEVGRGCPGDALVQEVGLSVTDASSTPEFV